MRRDENYNQVVLWHVAGMLPHELAQIAQYDMLQIDGPMPIDSDFGIARFLAWGRMVVGDAVNDMNDSSLLHSAMVHPCCANRSLSSLI